MKNLKYSGIIFDLDGTLVDTVGDLTDALNKTLEFYGFGQVTVEEMKKLIGNGLRRVIELTVPEHLKTDDSFIEEALERLKNNYSEIWVNKTKAYPGIDELLDFCTNNGVKLGVSSNKVDDATNYIIGTIFPDTPFVSVIGHRDNMPHKPNPIQTDLVVSEMKLTSDEILYVGDSEVDYMTAKNSGLDFVLLTYGYGDYENLERFENARILDSPLSVISVLEGKI